jgi:hypothetical protein
MNQRYRAAACTSEQVGCILAKHVLLLSELRYRLLFDIAERKQNGI